MAAVVGINQATLLYHFRDKEALIIAMVDALIARLRAVNDGKYAVEPGSLGGFDAHLRSLCELYLDDPGIYAALTEIATRSIRDERIAGKIAEVEREWTGYITHLLRTGAPAVPFERVEGIAAATIVFLRGVAAKAAGDGTLAALLARPRARRRIAAPLFAAVDAYVDLVHRALREATSFRP